MIRIFLHSAENNDIPVIKLGKSRWNPVDACLTAHGRGFENALVDYFPIGIGAGIGIGSQSGRVENVNVTLGIEIDLGIDGGCHFAQAHVGVDEIFVGVFHAQVELR